MGIRFNVTTVALLSILGIGLWGGLSVSYANFTAEQACPHLAGLAICYIVTIAYGLMLMALFTKRTRFQFILFFCAWAVTFLIALSGSVLEALRGAVCPTTSYQLPLCYVSLAMCLAIAVLYSFNRFWQNARPTEDSA
jgi:uncharacterized membrane protein